MRRILMIGAALALALPAWATLEWSRGPVLKLDEEPVAMVESVDGERLFVLTRKGSVLVLGRDGRPEAEIPLGFKADFLSLNAEGSRLLLTERATRQIHSLQLDERYAIPTAGAPAKGEAKAPVTLVVFSDFECPYCARLPAQLDPLLDEYPGKVRLVFKNYPLRNHKMALPAAQAALAAHEQGRFWDYHDKLFAAFNQLSEEKLTLFAKELGLDLVRFDRDRRSLRIQQQIQLDMQHAQAADLRGTPAVYINGLVVKNRSPEGFRAMIEAELANGK